MQRASLRVIAVNEKQGDRFMANIFGGATFDTSTLATRAVILNDEGIIDGGPYGANAATYGFTAEQMDYYILSNLLLASYSVVTDVQTQFPDATYYYGVTTGVTSGGVTTVYADNGIEGDNGSDVILDVGGDNIIDTNGGDDLVMTGFGADKIRTGSGNDIVFSNMGDDIVDLKGGDDIAYLYDGDDKARGGGGHDEIYGERGDDEIWGQGGRDLLDGGEGMDILNGGGGKDILIGGLGDDILTGGKGRDRFIFDAFEGDDTITDFEAAKDVVELSTAHGVSSFNDLAAKSEQIGNTLVLRLDGGNLLMEDTTLTELDADNFDFF